MRKQILNIVLAVFMLVLLLPVCTLAANTEDEIQVTEQGVVSVLSEHAAAEGISTLQLSLKVEPVQADAVVSFAFAEDCKAKIAEFRYHKDTGLLNLYLSGTKGLFDTETDSLTLGTVTVQDENGEGVTATVSVVADSLKYVYGTKVQQRPAYVLDAVTINAKNQDTPDTPDEPDTPDTPDEPDEPENPENPGNPENPEKPENPGDFNNPDTPGEGGSGTLNAERFKELETTLTNARTYSADQYTAESYAVLKAAMEEADALMKRPDATDAEIEEAVLKLQNAIGVLDPVQGGSGNGSDSDKNNGTNGNNGANGNNGTKGTSGNGSGNKTGANKAVKSVGTGDNTMVLPFVILLVAAAAVLVVYFIRKKKMK